ncbi:hypothetical protein RO07_21800 [Pandoraea pulmonicola]|uniref:Uncharacterized protein n=1 Tax=Pandoraea pulmonicola TaxID=93221 RepID=A0ABM5S3W0_PANPU|nr:hypothetical protein RO07_21800 [Pandoraea pulmonicola]
MGSAISDVCRISDVDEVIGLACFMRDVTRRASCEFPAWPSWQSGKDKAHTAGTQRRLRTTLRAG